MTEGPDLIAKAQAASEAGEPDRAAALYRRALEASPKDFKALRNLAVLVSDRDRSEASRLRADADRIEAQVLTESAAGLLTLGFADKAESVLIRARELSPQDTDVLHHMARIRRTRGDLAGAAKILEESLEIDPDQADARFALDLLQSRAPSLDPPPEAIWPVPFVHRRDFLSAEQRKALEDLVIERQADFQVSTVKRKAGHVVVKDTRSSQVLKDTDEMRAWFQPLVLQALPEVQPHIRVAPFEVDNVDLQVTVSHGGDFYKAHRDGDPTDKSRLRLRRVSFVYYFHRHPRAFSGGTLKLYDSDRLGLAADRTRFTTLPPDDNSIVFFPSCHLHEVEPVRCDSTDFLDGRFTVNGWIYCPEPTAEEASATAVPD